MEVIKNFRFDEIFTIELLHKILGIAAISLLVIF
jgi:hypothetical protein